MARFYDLRIDVVDQITKRIAANDYARLADDTIVLTITGDDGQPLAASVQPSEQAVVYGLVVQDMVRKQIAIYGSNLTGDERYDAVRQADRAYADLNRALVAIDDLP